MKTKLQNRTNYILVVRGPRYNDQYVSVRVEAHRRSKYRVGHVLHEPVTVSADVKLHAQYSEEQPMGREAGR